MIRSREYKQSRLDLSSIRVNLTSQGTERKQASSQFALYLIYCAMNLLYRTGLIMSLAFLSLRITKGPELRQQNTTSATSREAFFAFFSNFTF